ncbi:MAG TPA: SRPBCC family protein [Pseudolabrys sp.]|nr:SRPBCC family protein [Pseudolabrys sp.]
MTPRVYELHYEENVSLPARAGQIFSYADDFSKLSSHMNTSSSMMIGGSMETSLDQARGQAVGSHVRMSGKIMGIEITLDEVVTDRDPPHHKAWETVGRQRLLVIDNYRLGFDIFENESDKSSKLRVFIDYNLPAAPSLRWLGLLFGKFYAKWCVQQMINDARRHFIPATILQPAIWPTRQ